MYPDSYFGDVIEGPDGLIDWPLMRGIGLRGGDSLERVTALRAPARFAISGADTIVRSISRAGFARRLREGCEARLEWRARRATSTRRQLYRQRPALAVLYTRTCPPPDRYVPPVDG